MERKSISKYLIINADDFGLDENIDRGIAESFAAGLIKSASLVPNGAAFGHALNLANEHSVAIGIHLCLTAEKPVLSREGVKSLINEEGLLSKDCYSLICKIYGKKIKLSEIERELEAQIKKVLDSGIIPTHLDGHDYIHLIPPVFDIIIKLAVKYGIKWIRYPAITSRDIHCFSVSGCCKKMWLDIFSAGQIKNLSKSGVKFPDFSYGIMLSGRLNTDMMNVILQKIDSGISDITCHPGYSPENKKYAAWRYSWQEEMSLLKSNDLKSRLDGLNIEVTNYGEISRGRI